jgi:hypothetical protein
MIMLVLLHGRRSGDRLDIGTTLSVEAGKAKLPL